MNRPLLTRMFRGDLLFTILVASTPAALVAQFAGNRHWFEVALSIAFILASVALMLRGAYRKARDEIAREAYTSAREARILQRIEQYNATHPEYQVQL